ncbi:baseplate J/gp47 family protein [Variovorax sp. UC74_104]|uniref:baseplate assembly protein n=1 Tax=Variovorax sp. UC74_104 TaxID=3374555 RepID=UPI0037571C3D
MSMDMSLLPAPAVIEVLDFEVILAARLASFQERYPDYGLVLESDPAYKLLEEMAYQELLMRQRINDAAKACMLAYATGTDLDNLGANYKVFRLVVTPADPTAVPPVEAVYEDDERFRERIQLAPEGITTAGPVDSYRFHALSASAQVADVGIDSPIPGTVRVTVLSTAPSGVPSEALLVTVGAALNDEKIRPLCDSVPVQGPEILETVITAKVYRYEGPAGEVALANGKIALDKWLLKIRKLGKGLPHSGIDAALHQPGVDRVEITMPPADMLSSKTQWVRVTAINVLEEVVSG